jgi:hypothetical protein
MTLRSTASPRAPCRFAASARLSGIEPDVITAPKFFARAGANRHDAFWWPVEDLQPRSRAAENNRGVSLRSVERSAASPFGGIATLGYASPV